MASAPVPFEVHDSGALLHGTKADLAVGDLLMPGRESNFEPGRMMNHVYVTRTLDAAVWGAELAQGDGPGHIYIVESDGALEDDPNVTDKKFPGNPTRSYRTREPVRILGEITNWVGIHRNSFRPCGTPWLTSSAEDLPSFTTDPNPPHWARSTSLENAA